MLGRNREPFDETKNALYKFMKLYIIGNGFDIAHGIPCRYSDFYTYLEKKDVMY